LDDIIRQAEQEDQEALVACVQAAYSKSIERIGKKPAPMLADYKALIAQGMVSVLADEKAVRGVLGMMPQGRNMFVENVAVDPRCQGKGWDGLSWHLLNSRPEKSSWMRFACTPMN